MDRPVIIKVLFSFFFLFLNYKESEPTACIQEEQNGGKKTIVEATVIS